ncbi:MAG TPA: NAD(P)-dependent oxidoreductase [Spirochaetia bacterium]|nr:NAD(P)-dependent oxidoreductase [Spirochaetia bacterium]
MNKIVVLQPKSEFNGDLQYRLGYAGEVEYIDSLREYSVEELIQLAKKADILAFDPDRVGGIEKASSRLQELLEGIPNLKGLALNTWRTDYLNKDYLRERNIVVSNAPNYYVEAIATQTVALLLGCAKRIFLADRRTQKRKYRLELGREPRSMSVGIVGLGHVGERVAELCKGLGMTVSSYNRTPKRIENVRRENVDDVLHSSDVVLLHLAYNEETAGFLSKEKIARIKNGAIVINMADKRLVSEKYMAEALKSGKIDQYAYETESTHKSPLEGIETALAFKPFGGYTREALNRNREVWVRNIEDLSRGNPTNKVSL